MNNHTSIIWTSLFFLLMAGCIVLGTMLSRHTSDPEKKADTMDQPVTRATSMTRTNTWYANVYKKFPTEPLFALPGAYRFDASGLSVSFPETVATPNTVFGSFQSWCSLGMESPTTAVSVARTGDWDAEFEVQSGSQPWRVALSQGSPVAQIRQFTGELRVGCQSDVAVTVREDGLVLQRGVRTILIQGQGLVQITQDAATSGLWHLFASEQAYRVLLVPPVTTNEPSFFAALPVTHTTETLALPKIEDGTLSVTYQIRTEQNESALTTLWPHHVLGGDAPQVLGEYPTQLGTLRLIRTEAFTTKTKAPVFEKTFRSVTDQAHLAQLQEAVRQDIAFYERETPPTGVYFLGTWLGGVASAAQIADSVGMEREREQLLDLLQGELVGSLKNFVYRAESTLLVAKNTEFGNDEGNDHHFHYGYYLRAAAVLVSLRPAMKEELEATIDELAHDIATTDRGSTRYPYIRNFSPYDGHSWADGYAVFGDGNNQESTSEALNAWYALSLWGHVTGNTDFVDTGRYLFATELSSVRAYWFGENNPFPTGYVHPIASLVWGGKRDYGTWFSGQAMHIHGIQWLPITPASDYLGTLPSFSERKAEILRSHPNPATHEWGDLYTAMLSYTDPKEAETLLSQAVKNRALKSTALLYQTVYQNLERNR